DPRAMHSFPTRRSSDLRPVVEPGRHAEAEEVPAAEDRARREAQVLEGRAGEPGHLGLEELVAVERAVFEGVRLVLGLLQVLLVRSEEHTSELQSRSDLV